MGSENHTQTQQLRWQDSLDHDRPCSYTDFPLGLSKASSLNSDESGTVIYLSGRPCSGPPTMSLTQHLEGKEGKRKEKGNSRLSACYCRDRS